MKKLLVLVLVLAMASSASAIAAWFEVTSSTAGPIGTYEGHDSYAPSTILTITMKADFAVGTIYMDIGATETDPHGTAEGGVTFNEWFDYDLSAGDVTNSGGMLLDNIKGTNMMYVMGMADPLAANETLFTWDFHVPDVPDSTLITIDGINYVSIRDAANEITVDDFDGLIIHVAPEPMTIVLLGLGGLFLRRRK